ncbi:MAG: class I SAM-dependent methyltransferase [Ilumatobacteraceae bacterium]
MAQNVYDDESFFAAYARLARSVEGLDGAPEWPDLRGMLPPIGGSAVLDLGCGYGWFCRWAEANHARKVLGVDLSERMLERARRDTASIPIEYERADLDELQLAPNSFDLIFSSLTFHYVADFARLVNEVAAAIVPGGSLVFSVEHPIFTAPTKPRFIDDDGQIVWPLDRYLTEGRRETDWLVPGVVKYHRTIETYLRELRRVGLVVDELIEWGPSAEQVLGTPPWAVELDRPPFLLVTARRP